jgi:GrpB-like predicted nucleotidyltransferase (UPF0157 family)
MRSDPIVICPYDPSWPESFELQRGRVTPVLSRWSTRAIEHIGSTAVPGLPAKNIIDMLAVVEDIDDARGAILVMPSVAWVHAPEPTDEADRHLSFCYPTIAKRSHHLHVVEARSDGWRGWLAFRDYLKTHKTAADEYASLKMQLANEHGQDPNARDDYRSGKSAFIGSTTAIAMSSIDPSEFRHSPEPQGP